eukprot:TRINITY_DN5529_c0_g1_i1.p1 TRINITY_DN5529_c0_g1~~TRINITY_DN5529_c0_g1_i1.p1  ORF type:complete len:139 (-),score=40.26 TRINITY_DN5529_c0_g1_i1:101-517(-)
MLRSSVFALGAAAIAAGVVAADDAAPAASGTVISDAASTGTSTKTVQPASSVTADTHIASQSVGEASSKDTEAEANKATNWLSRLGDWGISSVVITVAAGPALLFSFYKRMQQEDNGFGCGRKDDSGSGEESDGDGIN